MKMWIIACAAVALTAGVHLLVEVTNAEPRTASYARTLHVAQAPTDPLMTSRSEPATVAVVIERGKPTPAETKANEDSSGPPPTADEMRAQIEASFAGDASVVPSQDRAPDLAKRVRAVMPAGSSVRSLECRSSLCRVETAHASLDEYLDFVKHGYLTLDFATRVSSGPVFVALLTPPIEGQPVVGVAFLGRDGAVLPTFAAGASPSSR